MNKAGITLKLTLIFILFGGVLLAGLSIPAYNSGRTSLQAATYSELITTALEKQAALDSWVTDRKESIGDIANQAQLGEEVAALAAAAPGSADAGRAHADLVTNLNNWSGVGQRFLSMEVIDAATGRVIAATDTLDEGQFREDQNYFINGLKTAYVQNPYYDMAQQAINMTAAAPILAPNGQARAVLAGNLDMSEVNAIIQRRSGLHQTDDAYLVNTSNLFVTQPRLNPDPIVLQRGVHTAAVNACLAHKSGVIAAPDYRDTLAFVVYRWLPERQLCLIVKIDQSEALAPVRALATTTGVAGGLFFLIGAAAALGLSRSIARPIRQLVTSAEQIGQGDLTQRITVRSGDEIGKLGIAFNTMASAIGEKETQLRKWATDLELRVEERTTELRASEERYRILSETSPDMIFVIDRQDKVQYVNTLGARQFGKTPGQVIGKERTELFPPGIAENQALGLQQVFKSDEPLSSESLIAFPGGQIWLDTQLVPLRNEAGEVSAVMGVSRDISERKRAEQIQARQSEDLGRSNAELERFAYVASHDLQEPLRMVISYLQLLERRYGDRLDDDAREFIAYAVDGSNRMKTLINDLLAYSRVGTRGAEFTPTDCEVVLERVLTNLKVAIEEKHALITHDSLPTVLADGVQLEQLFQNLVWNGIKFNADKIPSVHISVSRKDRNWVFAFKDNGIGIDPQYFERIFIIFQRLHTRKKFEGTGIGLAIGKRIVERLGGRIWVESLPGHGSTFYFSIPFNGESPNE